MKNRHVEDGNDSGKRIATQENSHPHSKLIELAVSSLDSSAHPRVEWIYHHEVWHLGLGVVSFVDVDNLRTLLTHLNQKFLVLMLKVGIF